MWKIGWDLLADKMPAKASELRLVVDQRLSQLERSLADFRKQLREAAAMLYGLGAANGPSGLAQQMKEIREGIDRLHHDELPYEIEDDFVKATAAERSARIALYVLIAFSVIIVPLNGMLLSEAFRGMGMTQMLAGVIPVSTAFAIFYVALEFVIGLLTHLCLSKRSGKWPGVMTALAWFLVLVAFAIIAAEFSVTNLIGNSQSSVGFEVSTMLVDQFSLEHVNIMGVFGFVIGSVNILAGFFAHYLSDELTELYARKRIVRDAESWNKLLTALPHKLGEITGEVNRAEDSLDSYLDSLGHKSESVTAAVDAVRREREAVDQALGRADLRNWPQWLGSDDGDAQQSFWSSIFIAGMSLVAATFFVWSFSSEIESGLITPSSGLAFAGAIGAAISFFVIGYFGFSKIQLLESASPRTVPVRKERIEEWAWIAAIALGTIAIWGFSFYARGWNGLAAGALNSFLAIALVWLGAQWDRFTNGFASGAIALLSLFFAAAFLIGSLLIHIIGWPMLTTGKIILLLLNFLAFPTDIILNLFSKHRVGQTTTPTSQASGT